MERKRKDETRVKESLLVQRRNEHMNKINKGFAQPSVRVLHTFLVLYDEGWTEIVYFPNIYHK